MFNIFVNPHNYRLMRAIWDLDVHKDMVYTLFIYLSVTFGKNNICKYAFPPRKQYI